MRKLIPASVRFWAMVDKSGGPDACWPFMGMRMSGGRNKDHKTYGYFTIARNPAKKTVAHRFAWADHHGEPVPEGRQVNHTCDNPPCCNPAHLVLGNPQTNAADAKARGRLNPRPGPGRKFEPAEILEIRRRRLAGERSKDLSREFDRTRYQINSIAKGRLHAEDRKSVV